MKRNVLISFTSLFFILLSFKCLAQKSGTYNVGIMLYDGVELLDFAGPGEVFAATSGFNLYTISKDGNDILSQGFVTVKPEYAIKDAPLPDILVLPGGGTSKVSNDQEVLDWINQVAGAGGINMSVCTGASILANAGLLDGLNITTWHGFIDRLQDRLPSAKVLKDTRFVDNGSIVTTAGVSAGIDGALHVVARIKGMDIALATARYMEYDKWEPEAGKVEYESGLDKKFAEYVNSAPKTDNPAINGNGQPLYFEGEMKNHAAKFVSAGEDQKAVMLLELTVSTYPNSMESYQMLSELYRKTGKFAPPMQEEFINLLTEGKIKEAEDIYITTQKEYPGWKIFSEGYINNIGYQYLSKEEFEGAIKIFRLNVKAYPNSANVYDSLGEAYLKAGDKENAKINYKKALELNGEMESAIEALKRLKQGG